MGAYNVMAIVMENRAKNAVRLQDVLTESGCMIRARIGLHDTGDACGNEGLIVLHLTGPDDEIRELEGKLNSIDGVRARNIRI